MVDGKGVYEGINKLNNKTIKITTSKQPCLYILDTAAIFFFVKWIIREV